MILSAFFCTTHIKTELQDVKKLHPAMGYFLILRETEYLIVVIYSTKGNVEPLPKLTSSYLKCCQRKSNEL